jgi:hypothetical protein
MITFGLLVALVLLVRRFVRSWRAHTPKTDLATDWVVIGCCTFAVVYTITRMNS